MRVLISGSRNWTNRMELYRVLHMHVVAPHWEMGTDSHGHPVDWIKPDDFVLVHGGCPDGADAMATDWCVSWDFMPEVHEADWKKYGKAAGPIRNQQMVDLGADLLIAFSAPCINCVPTAEFHWSHGTEHTIRIARKAGIPTIVCRENPQ